ncbi:polymorphic toxin-type HINT domain-containing protein [Actinoplanes aureus]|uniref:RHS repeat protein n=1 Tax=Actinoplanes aureus TaxID=2792083 RepID=A0A931CFM3_9ACTN|nr:polymorphic toxin-type HINT domain-containing protein [Actinoplanes aureus]MBG0569015.1 RHS repeat protein [Actinoplanes aureus]
MTSSPPASAPPARRLLSQPRIAVAASLAVTLVLGLGHAPAMAAQPAPYKPQAAKPVPTVPVKAAKITPAAKGKQPPQASARPAPTWPQAAGETIDMPAPGAPAVQADMLPVRIEQPAKSAKARSAQPAPSSVLVEILDRKTTDRAGVRGVLMRLGRADGVTAAGTTKVTLDYQSFATAYGADWSSRLRLVSLPACALTTPQKTGCEGTPLASDNDVATQTLSADVAVSSAPTLVATTAAAAGPAGDYSATTLNASSTWSAGGNSGAFTWNYPMKVPPSLGGPAPEVKLSYSSQSVDGRHAASNNQPSRVGEGFEEAAGGYIERRYQSCAQDMNGSANNDKKTGDLCWETYNATLSLAGHSGELIYNSTEKLWHLRSDDGSKIERKTGATNGDNDGEHWVLTTTDGVQYWFGINRLVGWTTGKPLTNSVLTVPVFGNDPAEPCHATAFADSDCKQAWRWNLDYVIDTSGNSMSYWYEKKTNKYGRNLDAADAADYDREAWLDRIDYGTRKISGMESVHRTLAPMRVDFDYADRCLSNCDTHNATRWPDVPWDTECTGASCEDNFSPTFWSTQRLASVTTQVRNGTTYRDVDRWTFTHGFPDPGDGTRAGLWLSKISHEGLVGGSAKTPYVEFTPTQLPNRVDRTGDFAEAMNWMRINDIRTETGGSTTVVYSAQDCQPGQTPDPATNTSRCYPVKWIPDGRDTPVEDWFNKYVVTTVYENDNTGGAPPAGSQRIVYKYDYYDGAAWHYTDDDGLIKRKYKTWSSYRGYGRVGVTVGDAGEQTYTETRYFRGMNGDRLDDNGGTKTVTVDGITDHDWFAGQTRETAIFNGPGGAVVSKTRYTPWASAETATRTINGDTVTARFTGVASTTHHVTLDGNRGERVTKTVNTFDEYGMVAQVDDLGQDGVDGDEQCTKTDYTPRNITAWIMNRAHRVQSYAVKCSATTGTLTEAQVIGETRTLYDDKAFEVAPPRGLATQVQTMSAWNNGTPTFTVTGKTAFDVHGRPTSVTDALGETTTTTYTPAQDGPVTSTLVKNPLDHEARTTIEPGRGTTIASVDPNGKRTDLEFDPLGRVVAVWLPGRTKGTDTPNVKYSYALNTNAPSVVSTSALNAAGNYVTSYTLYDGLLRQRQTQAPSLSPSGGRIVTESFYDTAGRQFLTFGAYHASGDPGTTLLATTDQASVPTQTRTVYDGASRTVADVFQPYGRERWRTTTAYGGDRTDITPPAGGTAASTVSDARGRTVELRQYDGPAPTPRTGGSWVSTKYKFDARGYQTQVIDDEGNDWGYTYDVRGRQVKVDDPDRGSTEYTYDNAGNILTSKDARGKKIAYDYDALGRKTDAFDNEVGGILRAQWIYDTIAKGQLSTSTRFVGSVGYQTRILDYNDNYQPGNIEIIIPETETGLDGIYHYNTTYNLDGSVKSTNIPGLNSGLQPETLTFAYDDYGQPTTVDSLYGSTNQAYVTGTDYNALGQIDQIKLHTGTGDGGRVYTKFTRELETGRLTGIRTDRDSVAPYIVTDTTYQYDNAGNITKIADAAPETVDDTQCFTYDNLRRLTEAWTPASGDCAATPSASALGGPAPYWHSWKLDTIGNRTEETIHTASGDNTTTYQYPASGATSVRPHAVTSTTGARTGSYTYDATGNTLTRPTASAGTQTLTWDAEGHIDTVTDNTGTTTYIYDADGNRLVQRDATGSTLYLPGQELRYNKGTATTSCTRYYSHAGATIGSRTSTGLTWLSADHQGTASTAINAANQQATTRRQTPYGTPRGTPAGAWPNNRGYVGGTNDNTGLTHLGAREYDPTNGRFISVDPLQDLGDPQQWNGYSYASNTPITISDPTGLMGTPDMQDGYTGDGSDSGGGGIPCPTCDGTSGGGGNGGGSTTSGGTGGGATGCSSANACEQGVSLQTENLRVVMIAIMSVPQPDPRTPIGAACRMRPDLCAGWLDQLRNGASPEGIAIEMQCGNSMACIGDAGLQTMASGPSLGTTLNHDVGDALLFGGATSVPLALIRAALRGDGGQAIRACTAQQGAQAAAGNSFRADTPVIMGDGSIKPIGEIQLGDKVFATDPLTGETRAEEVTVLHKNLDMQLVDVQIVGDHGKKSVVHTTADHPFWDATLDIWIDASDLETGHQLETIAAGTVTVTNVAPVFGPSYMYNLTVKNLHTYYVVAGNTPILVHNDGDNTTREGFTRDNPGDWKRQMAIWDRDPIYKDILSKGNRWKIQHNLVPKVDAQWVRFFPGDANLIGEKITMHHIAGHKITVPLPTSRHHAAHQPGGTRYNPGGPGCTG